MRRVSPLLWPFFQLLVIVLLALVLGLSGSAPLYAESPVIDSFVVDQAPLKLVSKTDIGATASSVAAGEEILGGERDLRLALTAGEFNGPSLKAHVASDFFALASGPGLEGVVVVEWDGPDGDAETFDPEGLGEFDLTAGGTRDAFFLEVGFGDNPMELQFEVFSDAENSSVLTLALPGDIDSDVSFVLPYADFEPNGGEGANFSRVGGVRLLVKVAGSPDLLIDSLSTTARLTASKADELLVDNDGDSVVDPGDTLRYTVVIANPADGNGSVENVTFNDTPDPNTTLVTGSVQTSQGEVTVGNGEGDTAVAVSFGSVDDGSSVTLTFEVTVNESLPEAVTEVTNQGTISGDNMAGLTTDDPDTDEPGDATVTVW